MSSAPPLPAFSRPELFSRLREGAAARITVLTPNRRLAAALGRQFDATQAARGLDAWETPDILPFDAFIARLHADALYSAEGAALPMLLSTAQEQLLWEQVIARSDWGPLLPGLARAAGEARKAWALAHHWRIDGMLGRFPGNEDAEAFALWASRYRHLTESRDQIDAARLPDLTAGLLGRDAVQLPRLLVLYAFDIVTPQQQLFIAACRNHGVAVHACRSEPRHTQPLRLPCRSPEAELAGAAHWARARLTEAGANPVRIGIVLPGLEQRRAEVQRLFTQALHPAWHDAAPGTVHAPFNISLGLPLARQPLAHAALALLQMALGESDLSQASRLLRSPFIGGARSEWAARARLDVAMRRRAPARVRLPAWQALLASLEAPPLIEQHLRQLREAVQALPARRQPLHAWAGHFARLLAAAGFPGERGLDSQEYQALGAWRDTLGELGTLSAVLPEIDGAQALARLRQLCEDNLFQPESGTAPIQVLGVLESAGLDFDHLWVAGMTDEAWPMPARPNPFIPAALQQKAGVPEAAAASALELDRQITAHWLGAAPEVVISHALREDDRELEPSPLIAAIECGDPGHATLPDGALLMQSTAALQPIPDPAGGTVPPLHDAGDSGPAAGRVVKGGTRVLADQAACPFRAFATHRLAAAPLEAPSEGLDAAARGTLLHLLMKGLWDRLRDRQSLLALDPGALQEIITAAATQAVARIRHDCAIGDTLAQLEVERLSSLATDWLDLERERADFSVLAAEQGVVLQAAGLQFAGRIDRMDRLEDGSCVLIDYKTGRVSPRDWEGGRPHDPQLPLYAVNAPAPVAAVVYARIRSGALRFMGYSRDAKVLPGVRQYRDWEALLGGWQDEVQRLGTDFRDGKAAVDPKQAGKTCTYCALQPLCRVHERMSALAADSEDTADSAGAEAEE